MIVRCIGTCSVKDGVLCFDGKKTESMTVFSATVCGKVIKGLKQLICGQNDCICKVEGGVSIFNSRSQEMRPLSVGAVVHRMGTSAEVYSANHRDGEQMTFPEMFFAVGADGEMSRCKKPSTVSGSIVEI